MTEENKSSVLRQVYYGEHGFGGIAETYKEAKIILNSITYNDTKQRLEKTKITADKTLFGV